ncbi:MAG: hypothetical protein JOZ68_03810 [Acidimicrobiia bacterium]|nr:hypothetical protein [Acidimicrobiia bacterium]
MRGARSFSVFAAALLLAGSGGLVGAHAATSTLPTVPPAIADAPCGPGSKPETGTQGRVSAADVASGRAAQGYTCNTEIRSHYGRTGGFKVFRYIDAAGHECAFYDSTLLFPTAAALNPTQRLGVFVLDMADPAHPVQTDALTTPAMLSPHESLSLDTKRGLLAADMGYPTFNPGFVDIYDVHKDCRHPQLQSSSPLGILGHEGNFTPDGNTFWVSSAGGKTFTALDISNPVVPKLLWTSAKYAIHGLNVSDDGNRVYAADLGNSPGLWIFDSSDIQKRLPNPQMRVVSHLTWPEVSIPQVPIPVTIGGHPYLVEIDEYSRGTTTSPNSPVGAARIIDIGDETHPKVISRMRLQVNQPANRAGDQVKDPGANFLVQGYAGHYCAVPSRTDPGIAACSFIMSGLRVFDIRDPYHPREIAYANSVVNATKPGEGASAFDMSAPAFAPERGEIWYADGNSGFYNVHLTNGVWPFATAAAGTAQTAHPAAVQAARVNQPAQLAPAAPPAAPAAQLATTGTSVPVGAAGAALIGGLALLGFRRRVAPR